MTFNSYCSPEQIMCLDYNKLTNIKKAHLPFGEALLLQNIERVIPDAKEHGFIIQAVGVTLICDSV